MSRRYVSHQRHQRGWCKSASAPLTPEAACAKKAFYADREAAAALGRLWGAEPYECPVCKLWHLTTAHQRGAR